MQYSLFSRVAFVVGIIFTPSAHADITIGLITPLTGSVAAIGLQVKEGAESAVAAINKNGGILGEKIVLKLMDSAGEPKQAVSVANQLIGDGVHFVVGPVLSGTAMSVADLFAENGTIMITPTATTPTLTDHGLWNVFRTCGRDDQQAEVAAHYVLKNFKDKRIAIIHDKGPYGKGLVDNFKAILNKNGVKEVLYEALAPREKDFGALITRIKMEEADIVYFGGYHTEAGLLARQLKDQNVVVTIIGGDGLSNTEYWAIADVAATGTLFTNASDATKNPAAADVIETLKAMKIPVEAFTLNTYAAVQVLKAGIEKTGSVGDVKAIAAALKSGMEIDTVIGKLAYSEGGDLHSPIFVFYKWKDGKAVAVE